MSKEKEHVAGPLDPVERAMEALFGLIMVLTFTGSLSVLNAGRQEVREMLIGALGCNLAWGIIDACFYLMGVLSERGRNIKRFERLRASSDAKVVEEVFYEALPEGVVDVMTAEERASLRQRLMNYPDPPRSAKLKWNDIKGAISVFFWVFLTTFPVALPFLFVQNSFIALRISNGIAILLLFFIGRRLARYAGFNVWGTSLFMVFFGLIMVAITIALGG